MTTVLLAIEDTILRDACRSHLESAGETAIAVQRPLALLAVSRRLRCDAVVFDNSELGRDAAVVAHELWPEMPVVGIGPGTQGASRGVALPLAARPLLDALLDVAPRGRPPQSSLLRLDPNGQRAIIGDSEVRLSTTEYRLLAMLLERSPGELSLDEALQGLWGQNALDAGLNALRVHVRNLRLRLASIGLQDAVQMRRGRGYALVLP